MGCHVIKSLNIKIEILFFNLHDVIKTLDRVFMQGSHRLEKYLNFEGFLESP